MGGFLPTAALSVLQLGFDAAQRAKQAKAAQLGQEHQAHAQILQIRHAQELEERERRLALKKALATQRARFGAQGIDVGGSSNSVLRGLSTEVDDENRKAQELANLRMNQINSMAAINTRRNLLESSQPTFRSAFGLLQKGLRQISLFG